MSMTRYPNGISTRRKNTPYGEYFHPDQTDEHRYAEDFNNFVSSSWTNTVVGTSTPALVAGDGGILSIATSATSSDSSFLQRAPELYSMEVGKPAWFSARFQVSALTSVIVMGLQVTDTTPEDVTDGIYWLSTTATGALTLFCRKNATTGSTSAAAGTLVAGAYTELAWYWDGKDTVNFFQDGVQRGSVTGVAASFLPDTTLTPSFGLRTTSAAIKTMLVDYFYVSKSRR